ncbi:MAG: TIGR03086 family metal-binding protein [Mycolicibacterium hassiacum]|jgi:uncharacterized protein (TIGR03086 family)|uniref:TIGR03086 family metal-binding protein n=1 Tax=Mycolicibacterium hassiacum TaxID=46351 RepID=UPI000DB66340|nr:TIGR03086 family metal-binding protein [Mycolicibacterium hassiacum]MBX5486968.1 TIGR03086 family protein [Mycolicibacterium hassiacum]PZN20731.1 MAG: TIGR03086 family protein [Mycolicibacterium hassiacum]
MAHHPSSAPVDELQCAEETFAVLQQVLRGIGADDLTRPTPCREFDVAGLTDHLLNSIGLIGGMAGAQLPARDKTGSIEEQVVRAARPTLDAWHRRGLGGTVRLGHNEQPATVMAGVLSLEFLVHAWDYATALGRPLTAPEPLSEYVLGLAHRIITPAGRAKVGFDDPIEVPDDASALDRLIGYTGRRPGRAAAVIRPR